MFHQSLASLAAIGVLALIEQYVISGVMNS
jgi:hypothetical protein